MNQPSESSPTPDENPYEAPRTPIVSVGKVRPKSQRRLAVWALAAVLLVPAGLIAGGYTCLAVAIEGTNGNFVAGAIAGTIVFILVGFFPVWALNRWWANK